MTMVLRPVLELVRSWAWLQHSWIWRCRGMHACVCACSASLLMKRAARAQRIASPTRCFTCTACMLHVLQLYMVGVKQFFSQGATCGWNKAYDKAQAVRRAAWHGSVMLLVSSGGRKGGPGF